SAQSTSVALSLEYITYDTQQSISTTMFGGISSVIANIGANSFNANIDEADTTMLNNEKYVYSFTSSFTESAPAHNTVYEEGVYSLRLTLDPENGTIPSGTYAEVSGTNYCANGNYIYIPVLPNEEYTVNIVSPTSIADEVKWNVNIYNGGSYKSCENNLAYNATLTFSNEGLGLYVIDAKAQDYIVSLDETSADIIINHSNISALTVSVEEKNPQTGVYTEQPSLTKSVNLPGSGNAATVTFRTGAQPESGTTYKLTFTGLDSKGNSVVTDTCYLVVSFIETEA
ncbi:MAG: hypothetical protein IIX39_02495, partial [Clostridia bacterium]|nr:hypothetical protein [Clostridia bacterium]